MPATALRRIPAANLFVSEPPPSWFGNGPNARNNPAWTNGNWLRSRFHFAFAEYGHGPANFGVLRVLNDDLVQPQRMFGMHGHRDMEILTYVVEGELAHKDSRGNAETLGPGSIQFMSAGTGIQHSEGNPGDAPLRFIQCWVTPRKSGLRPKYGSARGVLHKVRDAWVRIAADAQDKSADGDGIQVRVQQDCNVYAAQTSKAIEFEVRAGRQAYLLCVDGAASLAVGGSKTKRVERHDAAEVYGPATLRVEPSGGSGVHLLMFEMAASGKGGRADAEE